MINQKEHFACGNCRLLLFFSLLVVGCNNSQSKPEAQAKNKAELPNVVVILTDDQGWGDFSFNGNHLVNTPHIDRLKSEGALFTRFYVSPVCAPTRASFLTGKYALRTGTSWVTHRKEVMRSSETTLAEVLRDNGYKTGMFGKWHNGSQYPNNPIGQGFQEFFGFSAGHWNNYFDTKLQHNDQMVQTKGFITDVLTDKALSFIEVNKSNPFFCYIPYNAPHSPFQVPNEFFDRKKELGISDKDACVYAMCENIDFNVGRIMNKLVTLGIDKNTIVMFFTDNGPNGHRFNGEMKGIKGSVDEGGVRVPLLVKWGENIQPGSSFNALTAHIDLLPTIADMCNIKLHDSLQIDGVSLKPLLLNEKHESKNRTLFALKPHPELYMAGSARSDSFRFVLDKQGKEMLYDMKSDPKQNNNIANDFPTISNRLKQKFTHWYNEVTREDVIPPSIPVGFGHHTATLPAVEAKLTGGLAFKGKMGWANDWVINFKSGDDICTWSLAVDQAGDYEFWVENNVSSERLGSSFLVITPNDTLRKTVEEEFTSDYVYSPDRVKRGEVYEKEWDQVLVGKAHLHQGEQKISFSTSNNKAAGWLELKSISIKKVK